METSHNQAVLFVFMATVALSVKGIFAKFAYETGMGVEEVLLLRFGLAAPLFWVGVSFWARSSQALTLKQWRQCLVPGVMFFVATYCDFSALSYLDVSLSRLILFTFPVIVMLLTAVLERKPPSLGQWGVFAFTYGGLLLVMAPNGLSDFAGLNWTGAAFAFGSACSYAIYLVSSQQIMKDLGSMRFTAASGTLTLAMLVLALPFTGQVMDMNFALDGIVWGVMIALFCTVLPFFFLFEGIRRCGATQASLITLAGPVITVLLAWAILGESLNAVQLIGAGVSIAAVASLKAGWLFGWLKRKTFFSRL